MIKYFIIRMKYIFKKIFLKINIFHYSKDKNLSDWIMINGDKTKRLDYDLNSKSIVFDVGGYQGQFASDIFSKYCCKIYIFEPVFEFYRFISNRFNKNNFIEVFNLGLSNRNQTEIIYINKDSSSFFKKSNEGKAIFLKDIVDFIKENNIDIIDLMKINIEGGEYDLMERLIESNLIIKIVNLQIQFHDFVPNSKNRMQSIKNHLNKTHELTYCYEYIWENWKKL